MELELGLKITKTKDDIDSISEYQLMKDIGPIFQSRETNTMFILTAHLKGYKRNCIDIKISKDGSKISISGEKPIQEMVMMGWVMQRKVVDVKGFNKVFKIPYGVNLDKIKGNYNEEEWILNIYMPKFVKGICGLKIEEVKEQEFDKRRLELEKGKIDHVSSSVGETSQKGSKDSEFKHMEGSENNLEKMLDDKIMEINKETIQKEVGEYKLGIEDGNGEKVRVNDGKEQYDVMKKSELDQSVGVFVPNTIEDKSQDKKIEDKRFECRSVEKKEREECDKRHDDANRDRDGSPIKKEKEESMIQAEEDVGKGISHNIVDTSHRVVEGSMIQQSGEPKEKEFGEKKGNSKDRLKESPKESSMEENVDDHIPSNIDSINKSKFGEPKVPQMEKIKSDEGKMNRRESKKLPSEANEDVHKTMFGEFIQKGVIRPKLESQDEDQECVREKLGNEGFDDAKITINEEFDKYLPRKNHEAREGLNVKKMQENKVVKENVVKRKGKEIEDFVEKDDNKRLKRMHVEAKKGNTKAIMQKEIEEIHENGIEESGKKPVVEIEGSKGFNVAKEEDQREFIKETLVDTQCLMEKVEGEESNERSKEDKVQDEEDKTDYGIVKLKGYGSRKLNVEPNERFEGDTTRDKIEKEITNQKFQENVHIGVFDGRKTQKFQEMEQKEDFKENGENIEKSMKKLNEDKYQQIQNEEIGNSKEKGFGELECETKDRLEESSIEPFDQTKASKLEQNVVDPIPINIGCINQNEFKEEYENPPFEAKEVVQKTMFGDIIKPKMENEDGDQDCVGEKANKEGFDAKIAINKEFPKNVPKNTHEESEGLNVQQMQETKDIKKNVVKRKGKKIEYLVEKSEGERLKRMHMEGKKGNNTRDTMQEEIEESDDGIKESDQQHAKENIVREKSEVSKNMTEELQHPIENVNGSNEFNVAEREDQKEVNKEALVESESLKEKVEEESKERIMAKKGKDEENKFEYGTMKLKGEGFTKLNVEPNEPFEGDTSGDKIEKEIINQKFQENVDIGIFDGRKRTKFQEMEETELAKEKDATIEKFMKKVNGDKFKIQNEVDEGFKKNITKEKDDCYLQEEMSKDRSKEEFPMKMLDSPGDTIEGLKSRKIEKAKGIKEESERVVPFVKEESEEPKIPMKIKDQQCLQETNDHEIEKAKKVKGKVEKRKSDEFLFVESTTKEEPQESKIERNSLNIFEVHKAKDPKAIEPRTSERELQSARGPTTYSTIESIGFKEFEYWSAKDKKQNTKVLPPNFQDKETHESKDESMSRKKSQEVGEHRTHSITSTKMEDPTKDIQNLIEMEETLNSEEIPLEKELMKGEKGEFHDGEKVGETMQLKTDDPKNEIDAKEKQYVVKDVGEVETKGKCFDEKMKTTKEKEAESLQSSQKNDIAEMKAKRPLELEMPDLQCELPKTKDHVRAPEVRDGEQCGYVKEGTEEIKEPKIEAFEGAKPSKLQSPRFNQQYTDEINRKSEFASEDHEETKESPKLNIAETIKIDSLQPQILDGQEEVLDVRNFQTQKTLEEKKVVKRREGPKIPKTEETKDASTLKREKGKTTQTTKEKKPKIMEKTPQFDMASGSKRVSEKMQEATKREYQRESEQVASKTDVEPPTTVEKTKLKKVERQKHIQVLEATISKEKEDRGQQYVQEKNDKKGFQRPKIVEEENVMKKMEGPKVAKSEEEEDKYKMEELTTPFDKACGSKRVADKVHEEVHETPEREHQRESEEFTSKMEVEPPTTFEKPPIKKAERKESNEITRPENMENEIPKVEEFRKEEGQKHIHELEATISKEKERVEPKSEVGKQKLRLVEDRGQQYVQEKKDNKGFQTPKTVEEEKVSRKREGPNVAKKEEEKKPKMKEIIPKFDKANGSKRVAENVHETPERENQRQLEVTSKIEVEPPTTVEKKEAHELTRPPNMNKEVPKVEEVQEENEREMHIHVTEATISKEKETQVTATHSQEKDRNEPKGKIDMPQENQILSPKEPFHSIERSAALEVAADKVTQQFEVEGEEKTIKRDSKMDVQESTKSKRGKKVEQCIIKDEETKHGIEEQKEGKDETSGWKKHNEIPKVEEKDMEKHIHVLEATVSKEKDRVEAKEGSGTKQNSSVPKNSPPKEPFHSMEGTTTLEAVADVKESKVSSSTSTQQLEVEGEEKTKKKESNINVQESTKSKRCQEVVEKCINKDEESKHGREEIDNKEEEKDYEQVYKEQKQGKDETSEGKKDNDKISKKLFVPFVIAAGSALLVTLVVMFVRHRKSRKR